MTDTIKYQSILESSRYDGDLETPLSDGKSTFGKFAFTEDIFDKDQHRALADIIKDKVDINKLTPEMRELINTATGVPENLVKDMEQWNNRIAALESDKLTSKVVIYATDVIEYVSNTSRFTITIQLQNANGVISKEIVYHVKECFKNKIRVSEALHQAFTRYFKEYICVGGLPEVVKTFIDTKDMNQVRIEQKDLIEEYKDDFAKHLDENEQEKVDKTLLAQINRVFDSLPSQLAKENKKFMVSKIDKRGSLEKYYSAIQWLVDYGLVDRCYNLSMLELPLEGNKKQEVFKLFFTDTGLLIASLDEGTSGRILKGDLGIYKGAIYEQSFADAYLKNNKKLFYFSKDSGLEIDFITENVDGVILLEVKAKDGRTKAALEVLNNKEKYQDVNKLIRLKDSNVSVSNNIETYPIYMSFLIP